MPFRKKKIWKIIGKQKKKFKKKQTWGWGANKWDKKP